MDFTTDVTLLVLSAFILGVTVGTLVMGIANFSRSYEETNLPKKED